MHSIYHATSLAKVNLFLFVDSKLRSTGLHTLRSVFCRASLSDRIRVEIFEGQEINSDMSSMPSVFQEFRGQKVLLSVRIVDELKRQLQYQGKLQEVEKELNSSGNCILDVIKLFFDLRRERGVNEVERFFVITLDKEIPLEAGLGGGSANAASVLQILSKHFSMDDHSFVFNVAKKTGNDVLPCLYSSPVFFDGEGIVTTKERGCSLEVIIIKPEQGSSTKEAFTSLNRPVKDTRSPITLFSEGDLQYFVDDFMNFRTDFHNDFQNPVFEQLPVLLTGKDILLKHGSILTGMNGSGSSLIGVFKKGILDENGINSIGIALGEGWFVKNAEIYL